LNESPTTKTVPRKSGSWILQALRVAVVRLRFVALLVGIVLLAAYWDDLWAHGERWFGRRPSTELSMKAGDEFFCPMHPVVVSAGPGQCPGCGMPLSRRSKGEAPALPGGFLTRVQFSPYRIAQAGIRTSPVERLPLEREIVTSGVVEYDERKLTRVTMRFHGRIESTAVKFRGVSVERGERLVTIYSPEVFAAEETLLSAARSLRDAEAAGVPDPKAVERGRALVDSARSRLILWGLWPEQLDAIVAGDTASASVDVLAPLSGVIARKAVLVGDYVTEGAPLFDVADLSTVWIVAQVYEEDLGVIAVGQEITATSLAYPGESFDGTIAFVDPILDRATRTADLRADVPNLGGRLKPGMYVSSIVRVPVAGIEPFRSTSRGPHDAVLAVPESAVIDTGRRNVVYVESSPGVFDAHEVVLGPRAGIYYSVIEGLDEGMRVATAGSFLIDAETRLDPAAAGTYFGASTAPESPPPVDSENRR
jgi:Cu(I)/Ag(I) efflux system membrane fusion protein